MKKEKQEKSDIIILHDTFLYNWWWERLIIMMAKVLNADLASGFFSAWSYDIKKAWLKWKIITVSSEVFKKWLRHLQLKKDFLFKTKFLKDYKTVIFSWDCISAVRNVAPWTKTIYYCHTPPRYLYDLYDIYINKVSPIFRPFFNLWFKIFRYLYERDIKKIDIIFTNSKTTQERLKKFLWIDSIVLYPPVDITEFKWISQDDYYLSSSRLSTAKRIDVVVRAFTKIPDKKLIVIYWVNDPQKDEIFEIAKGYENITFIPSLSNEEYLKYVWNCIANICIPVNEDFWMVPIEYMSAWKPCIWVNEWWLRETIIDWKTWFLIPEWANVEDLIKAVKTLTKEKTLSMKEDCEKQAKNFSLEHFEQELKKYIDN